MSSRTATHVFTDPISRERVRGWLDGKVFVSDGPSVRRLIFHGDPVYFVSPIEASRPRPLKPVEYRLVERPVIAPQHPWWLREADPRFRPLEDFIKD